jgi:hypothetical protein
MIGGRASVSAKKLYDIANPCSSSYMPPPSNAGLLILKGPLLASPIFSSLFPVFILNF